MSDYADLCNESADELEAAHDRIELLAARIVALETVLGDVVACAEEGSFGVDWEGHHADCACVICACRAALKEPKP